MLIDVTVPQLGESVTEGTDIIVELATIGSDGPTGTFTRWENTTIPW